MSDIFTPSFIFDIDIFRERIMKIGNALPGIPLTYSIKANPFLIPYIPDEVRHLEVCSPGELAICRTLGVTPERIIYSGVMKETWDIEEALSYGVDIITAESLLHYELIKKAEKRGRRQEVLLRLSSGNQFGMPLEDICSIIEDASDRDDVHIKGLHYFSGTGKGIPQIKKDIDKINEALDRLKNECSFECEFLEYGPGLNAEVFAGSEEECENKDMELLDNAARVLEELKKKCDFGVEMGRFIAAPCGSYETAIKDIKETEGVSYIITDGGIHHLNYYGQNMAMRVPVIEQTGRLSENQFGQSARPHFAGETDVCLEHAARDGEDKSYTVCGSLCTTADILVRSVSLKGAQVGDALSFKRSGAYAVTEAPALFLSRRMPAIYIRSSKDGVKQIRSGQESYLVNLPDDIRS